MMMMEREKRATFVSRTSFVLLLVWRERIILVRGSLSLSLPQLRNGGCDSGQPKEISSPSVEETDCVVVVVVIKKKEREGTPFAQLHRDSVRVVLRKENRATRSRQFSTVGFP